MKLHNIILLFGLLALFSCKSNKSAEASGDQEGDCPVVFCADSAYQYIEDQCSFGPRTPNSAAHDACADYIAAKFESYGLTVTNQTTAIDAWDGTQLQCRNIIASYRPADSNRVLFCAHYDCRPWADADVEVSNHRTPVDGANDGASGIAVMLEMARQIRDLNPKVGVDFVCFDAEDYGEPEWSAGTSANELETWCLGSQYWAKNAVATGYKARYGVLLDMVGGRGSKFCYEQYSLQYAQGVVIRIWDVARRAGTSNYFPQTNGVTVTDDHVPVNRIARIPTVDILPYFEQGDCSFGNTWHTVNDTPQNIDPDVLAAVGQTMVQLLWEEEENPYLPEPDVEADSTSGAQP